MSKEAEYLEHKKKTIINIIKSYNIWQDWYSKFEIDEENLDIDAFSYPNYCNGCGACCRHFPCAYSPNDFLDITDLDYMRKILNTGVVTIMYYNNFSPLIIRNRGVYDSNRIACADIDTYNSCILHTEGGCMLPPVYRGSNGLLYLRKDDGYHRTIYGEKDFGYLYEYANPFYQESLRKLYEEYRNVVIPTDSINEENVNQFIRCLINKND